MSEKKLQLWLSIEVNATDDFVEATASIRTDRSPSIEALVVACEQMMTMVAMESDAGFDKALELLCEGARSNKVSVFKGKPVQ